MRTNMRLLLVAALVAGWTSSAALADDGGDNGMTPNYGDSWAALQGRTAPPVPGLEQTESAAADVALVREQWARMQAQVRSNMQRWEDATARVLQPMKAPPATEPAPAAASQAGTSY